LKGMDANMHEKIRKASEILKTAQNLAVLTGAGVSAESNVPTFRGEDGYWKKHRAEDLATPGAFNRDPKTVWEWYGYRQKLISSCEPNPAHSTLAEMEDYFKDFILITQNVDNLHQRAGSVNVLELHGNIFKARCPVEGRIFDFTLGEDPLPGCEKCGALIRPNVVWFGESLDPDILREAFERAARCDVFLVIGTSALVQPAASLPLVARDSGATVIELNLDKTPISPFMNISIRGKAGEILPKIREEMKKIN